MQTNTLLCTKEYGGFYISAYIVVDTNIHNLDKYEVYKKLAKPIAEKYGGVYRVRGGEMDVRESELWRPTRIVIIEFPDVKSAQNFVDSDEYSKVKHMRLDNAECTLFIVDGG